MRKRLLAAIPFVALSLAMLSGCATNSAANSTDPVAEDTVPAGTCQYVAGGPASKEVELPESEPVDASQAVIETSEGDITIAFDSGKTPCTVNSFVSLAEQGYFNDTSCHRLTTSGIYVLQCGDPTATGTGGPGYRFPDEVDGSETYPAGTVAMANAGPDTNGSQFFLVYGDSSILDPEYTVFGHMDEASTALVAKIAGDGTESGLSDGAPATPVEFTGVTIG